MRFVTVVFLCLVLTWSGASLQEFPSAFSIFAAAVYKEVLKTEKGNILVSPLSAEIITALAEAGAKDVTAAEIRSGLRLPSTEEQTRSLFVKLLPTLKGDGEFSLSTANKIYVRQNFSIKDEFKQVATSVYLADLENLDFSKSDEAASAVNKWVEQQTGHKIKNLLKPGDVDGSTVVILVNALYFKGTWRRQFPKFATAKRKFHTTSAEVMEVESMHEHGAYYNYWESSEVNAKFLELPFKGDDVSMVVILPNEREGVGALESQIEKVLKAPHFTKEFVEVVLPKFKIESQIGFKRILENLGVQKAFGRDADFSGIAGDKGDLFISEIIQKTFIDVDEAGVEAAAATFLSIRAASLVPHKKQFIAEHPFLFYLQVKKVVLFVGKVTNPQH